LGAWLLGIDENNKPARKAGSKSQYPVFKSALQQPASWHCRARASTLVYEMDSKDQVQAQAQACPPKAGSKIYVI